jgi:hypothetical protein
VLNTIVQEKPVQEKPVRTTQVVGKLGRLYVRGQESRLMLGWTGWQQSSSTNTS